MMIFVRTHTKALPLPQNTVSYWPVFQDGILKRFPDICVNFFCVQIANMKKEINAIRVKDISQGGLTQGQQTQIARNEQRMAQVMLEKLINQEPCILLLSILCDCKC